MAISSTAILLLLFTITCSSAARNPQNNKENNLCSTTCYSKYNSQFEQYKSYFYEYEATTQIPTDNKGAVDTMTELRLKSKIVLTALSACEFKLNLQDVKLDDRTNRNGDTQFRVSVDHKKMKLMLEKEPVYFNTRDNFVKSVCYGDKESQIVVNIKKSIIDQIANYKKKGSTQMVSTGTVLIDQHEIKYTSITPGSFLADIAFKQVIEKAETVCKKPIHQDPMISSECTETVIIRPIKNKPDNIKVVSTTQLKFMRSKVVRDNYSKINQGQIKSSLKQKYTTPSHATSKQTESTLKTICNNKIQSEQPSLFMQLVDQIKSLDSQGIEYLYDLVFNNPRFCSTNRQLIKTMLIDAVSYSQNPDSIKTVAQLVASGVISAEKQMSWFAGLAESSQRITEQNLNDLYQLLLTQPDNQQLILGTGSLIRQFCSNQIKMNAKPCEQSPAVQKLFDQIKQPLGINCQVDEKYENNQLSLALRSIQNAEYFTTIVFDTLNACVANKKTAISIRIGALEALQKRKICKDDKSELYRILLDIQDDSEVRINAYLAIMKCVDVDVLFQVRKILENEKSNQVGSFIWTHLTNIKESNDVLKTKIRSILQEANLKKEFNLNKLKYSRNIEKTFETPFGKLTLDSNVIFSQKSFVPRSISLKTTSTILESPRDFLELKARTEGLEEILFKLLGPEGYLKSKSGSTKELKELMNLLNKLRGSFDLKLFGQQVSFMEFSRGNINNINKVNIIQELINLSKLKTMNVNKNIMLADNTLTVFTIMGLPLNFRLRSAAIINSNVKSSFQLPSTTKNIPKLSLDTQIKPKIATQLQTDIVINTPFTNYGLRYDLRSSTDMDVRASIKFDKNSGLKVNFNVPKRSQTILDVSSQLYLLRGDKQMKLNDIGSYPMDLCTYITTEIGLKLCGESTISPIQNPFPFLRNFRSNYVLHNVDAPNGYEFRALYSWKKDDKLVDITFDTPNSKLANRKFTTKIQMTNKRNNVFEMELINPWVRFMFNLKKISIRNGVKHSVEGIWKDKTVFKYTQVSKEDSYVSSLKIMDDKEIFLKYKENEIKKTVHFKTNGIFGEETYVIINSRTRKVNHIMPTDKYKIEGKYKFPFARGNIKGHAQKLKSGLRFFIKLKNFNKDNKITKLMINHMIEDKSINIYKIYMIKSDFKIIKVDKSEIFFNLNGDLKYSQRYFNLESKVELGTDKIKESIEFNSYNGFMVSENPFVIAQGNVKFIYSPLGINYIGQYITSIDPRKVTAEIKVDEDENPILNAVVEYEKPTEYLPDCTIKVDIKCPKFNGIFEWNLMHVDVNKYEYELKYDRKAIIKGAYTMKSSRQHHSEILVTLPTNFYKTKFNTVELTYGFDFFDIKQSMLTVRLNVPQIKYSLGMDTQFTYKPNNFMVTPITTNEQGHVLTYKTNIFIQNKKYGTKFEFICNPSEFKLYSNLIWENKFKQIEMNVHYQRSSSNTKQMNSAAELFLRYPGNFHKISFQSEFNYLTLQTNIDITLNRNQKYSVMTMYNIDNGWTQKGITAQLTVKTPITGFEFTHIGINAVGQLRYRKVDLEVLYGKGKKIKFQIIVEPRSSNDFTVSTKLITPFKGLSLIETVLKHMYSERAISSEATLNIGTGKRHTIKFEAVDSADPRYDGNDAREITASLLINSPGYIPRIEVTMKHKNKLINYETEFRVTSMDETLIEYKSKFTLDIPKTQINLDTQLKTLFNVVKYVKLKFGLDGGIEDCVLDIDLSHNNIKLLKSTSKVYFEKSYANDITTHEWTFDSIISKSIVVDKSTIKGNLRYSYSKVPAITEIKHYLSIHKSQALIYRQNVDLDFVRHNIVANIKLHESSEIKNIKLRFKPKYGIKDLGCIFEIKLDEKYLTKHELEFIFKNKQSRNIEFVYEHKIFGNYLKKHMYTLETNMNYNPKNLNLEFNVLNDIEKTDIVSFKTEINSNKEFDLYNLNDLKIKSVVNTQFESIKSLSFEINLDNAYNPFKISLNANLNNENKLAGALTYSRASKILIDFDIQLKTKYQNYFLKFKHVGKNNGFLQQFNTNLYHPMNYKCSVVIRAPLDFNIQFKTSILPLLETIDLSINDVEVNTRKYNFAVKYDGNWQKLQYEQSGNKYFLVKVKTNIQYNVDILLKFDVRDYNNLDIKLLNKPNFDLSMINKINKIKQNLDSSMSIKCLGFFEFMTRLETVKWRYISLENVVKFTNSLSIMSEYKFGGKYDLKIINPELQTSLYFNDKFIKLVGKLENTKSKLLKVHLSTSCKLISKMQIEFKHRCDKINRMFYQNLEITLISKDKIYSFKHSHKLSVSSFRLDTDLILSNINLITLKMRIPLSIQQPKYLLLFKTGYFSYDLKLSGIYSFKTKKAVNFDFKMQQNSQDIALLKLNYDFENAENMKLKNDINIKSIFKHQISVEMKKQQNKYIIKLTTINSLLLPQKLQILSTFENPTSAKLNIKYDKSDLLKFKYQFDTPSINANLNIKDVLSAEIEIDENKDQLLNVQIKTRRHHVNIQTTLTHKMLAGTVKYNEHFVTFKQYRQSLKFFIDLKIMNRAINIESGINKETNKLKCFIKGTSNIEGYKNYQSSLVIDQIPSKDAVNVASHLSIENQDLYRTTIETVWAKYLSIKINTKLEVIQNLVFVIDASRLPDKFNLQLVHNEKNQVNIQLHSSKLTADWKSKQYNGRIMGELKKFGNIRSGEFTVTSQQLEKTINGQISIENKGTETTIDLKLPFLNKLNKLSIRLDQDKLSPKLVIKENDEKVLDMSVSRTPIYKFTLDIDAKSLTNFQLSHNMEMDLESDTKYIKVNSQSSMWQKIYFESTHQPIQQIYEVKLTTSIIKTDTKYVNSQLESSIEYLDKKYELVFKHNFKNFKNVDLRLSLNGPQSIYFNYNHQISNENGLSINIESLMKVNQETLWSLNSEYYFKHELIKSKVSTDLKLKVQLNSKKCQIIIKRTNGNFQINLKTPFEVTKQIELYYNNKQSAKSGAIKITFKSNYLGDFEMNYKHQIKADNKFIQIVLQSPQFSNCKLTLTRSTHSGTGILRFVNQFTFDSDQYHFTFDVKEKSINLICNTPISYLKNLKVSLDANNLKATYNTYNVHLKSQFELDLVSLQLTTNIDGLEHVQVNYKRIGNEIAFKVEYLKSSISAKVKVNSVQKLYEIQFSNTLIDQLPMQLSGLLNINQRIMKLEVDQISIIHATYTTQNILIKTPIFKLKSSVSGNHELTIMNPETFNIKISGEVLRDMEIQLTLNQQTYFLKNSLTNNDSKFLWNMSISPNMLQFKLGWTKIEPSFDSSISYKNNKVFVLKFDLKRTPTKYGLSKYAFKSESRLLTMNTVVDLTLENKLDGYNVDLSWNMMKESQQLQLGSLSLSFSTATNKHIIIILNLISGLYEFGITTKNSYQNINLKLITPIPTITYDISINHKLNKEAREIYLDLLFKNRAIGEYSCKLNLKSTKGDSSIKLVASNSQSELVYLYAKLQTLPDLLLETKLKILNSKPFTFTTKFSKGLSKELILMLTTPYKHLKHVKLTKKLRYNSLADHDLQIMCQYSGIYTYSITTNHKLMLAKKLYRFKSNILNENSEIASFEIDHSGDHRYMEHLVIWKIRNRKYGWNLNGKMNPFFTGKSELYFPSMNSNEKVTLSAKQSQDGFELQSSNQDSETAELKYIKSDNGYQINIVPYPSTGKRIDLNIQVNKRTKRSIEDDDNKSGEFTLEYGKNQLMHMKGEYFISDNKLKSRLEMRAPMFTARKLEVSVFSNKNDDKIDFDHYLKLDDDQSQLYRLFGQMFMESSENLGGNIEMKMGNYGKFQANLGHTVNDNKHSSFLTIKKNDENILNYIGKLSLDKPKDKCSGEWSLQFKQHNFRTSLYYQGGKTQQFKNDIFYNNLPIYSFNLKTDILSTCEFQLKVQPQISVELKTNQNTFLLTTKYSENSLIVSGNQRKFIISYFYKNEQFILFDINCNNVDSLKLRINYYQHFLISEIKLYNDEYKFSLETSLKQFEKLSVSLKRTSLDLRTTTNDQVHNITASYKALQGYHNIKFTMKCGSLKTNKFNLELGSESLIASFNQYKINMKFKMSMKSLTMKVINNFMPAYNLDMDMNMQDKLLYIKLDDKFIKIRIPNLDKDNLNIDFDNNVFRTRSIKIAVTKSHTKFFFNLKMNNIDVIKVDLVAKSYIFYQINFKSRDISIESKLDLESKFVSVNLGYQTQYLLFTNKIESKSSITMVITNIKTNIIPIETLQNKLTVQLTTSQYSIDNELIINETEKFGFSGVLKSTDLIKMNAYAPRTTFAMAVTRNADKVNIQMKYNNNKVTCEGQFNTKILKLRTTYKYRDQRNNKLFDFNLINNKGYKLNLNVPNVIGFSTEYKDGELKIAYGLIRQVKIIMQLVTNTDDVTTCRFHISDSNELEFGIKMSYKNQNKPHVTIYIENQFHIIGIFKSQTPKGQQYRLSLENKNFNKKWSIDFVSNSNEKYRLAINTPISTNNLIELQISRKPNNQLQLIRINILDILEASAESSQPSNLIGKIKLFKSEIGQIIISKNSILLTFSPTSNKKDQISVKLTKMTSDAKLKEYSSQYRLIIKQPLKNIDIDISQTLLTNSISYQQQFSISHLTVDKVKRHYKFSINFDKSQSHKIKCALILPSAQLKLESEIMKPSTLEITYKFRLLFNEKEISGFVNMNSGEKRGLTTRYYYDPEHTSRYIQAHFKYLSSHEFETAIFRKITHKITKQYFKLSVQNLAENKLRLVYFQNRDFVETIQKYTKTAFRMICSQINEIVNGAIEELFDQGKIVTEQFVKNIPKDVYARTKELIERNIKSLRKEISSMMSRNEFYIQTIVNSCLKFVMYSQMIYDKLGISIKADFYLFPTRFFSTSTKVILYPLNKINSVLTQSLKVFDPIFSYINNRYPRIITLPFLNMLNSWFESAQIKIQSYLSYIFNQLPDDINDAIGKLYYYQHALIKIQIQALRSLQKSMKGILPYLRNDWTTVYSKTLIMKLENKLSLLKSTIFGFDHYDLPEMFFSTGKSVIEFMDLAMVEVKRVLFQMTTDDKIQDVVYLMRNVENLISESRSKLRDLTSINPIKVYSNSYTRKGYLLDIAFTLPLPVIKDLNSLPHFTMISKKINRIQQKSNELRKLFKSHVNNLKQFQQLVNWFTPYLSLRSVSIIPEFQKYATLAPSVITTFDKQTYNLLDNPCRIVLVKENLYKHWKLTMQKLKDGKVYEFEMNNGNILKIPSNGEMVSLNDKIVNLPLTFSSDITVISVGKIVRVSSKKYGLTLTIDVENDILTVGLSNWYHGKVIGLFGNADNEPMNDLMNEKGKIVNINQFLKDLSDQTSDLCSIELNIQTKSKLKQQTKPCPFIRKIVCKFLYGCPVSPLAGCFKSVDPSKFYQICMSSSNPFEIKADTKVCDSARSYAAQCKKAGIQVPLPYPCRKCSINKNNKEILVDETINIKTKIKEVDIVMVVSEDKCMNEFRSNLKVLIAKLDKTLYSNGITQVRYGLVSSGSTNIPYPYSHSVGYKLFGNKNDLIKTIDSLKTHKEYLTPRNTKKSLDIALNYPYKMFASSQIIYVSCHQVQEDINSLKPIFKAQSITFNYLTSFTFAPKNHGNKKVIYGVDKDQFYGLLKPYGDSKDKLSGSLTISESDSLYNLAMEQDGVVFDMNMKSERFIDSLTIQLKRRAKPVSSAQCTCLDDQKLVCKQNSERLMYPDIIYG